MGMSDAYGPADEAESVATIHRDLELGINLLDTSDAYGPFTNEDSAYGRGRRHPSPAPVIGARVSHLDDDKQNTRKVVRRQIGL